MKKNITKLNVHKLIGKKEKILLKKLLLKNKKTRNLDNKELLQKK